MYYNNKTKKLQLKKIQQKLTQKLRNDGKLKGRTTA